MGPLFKNVALTLGANFFNPNGTPCLGPILAHGSRGRVAKIRDTIGPPRRARSIAQLQVFRGASWKHRILTSAAHRPPNYSLSLLFSFFFLSVLFFRFVLFDLFDCIHATRACVALSVSHMIDTCRSVPRGRRVRHTCRRAERVPRCRAARAGCGACDKRLIPFSSVCPTLCFFGQRNDLRVLSVIILFRTKERIINHT